MPIDRHSSDILVKLGYHYAAFPEEIHDQLRDPGAIAIWTHLIFQAPSYRPSKTALMARYNLSEHAWRRARKELEDLDLLRRIKGSRSGSQDGGTRWYISSIPIHQLPEAYGQKVIDEVPSLVSVP